MKTKVLYPYTTRPRDTKLHMMLLQVPGPNALREGREVAVKENKPGPAQVGAMSKAQK